MASCYLRVCLLIFFEMCIFDLPNNHVGAVTLKIVEEQSLWLSKESHKKTTYYRIPLLTNTPTGDLLAFVEGRNTKRDIDLGMKSIFLRRSRDKGETWGEPVLIIEDSKQVSGRFNLGSVIVDRHNGTLIVLLGHCTLWNCGSRLPSVFMIKSYDWGCNWTTPISLANHNVHFSNFSFIPGPGIGVQKQYSPFKGRLIVCGRTQSYNHLQVAMRCIVSDDHGDSWRVAGGIVSIPYNEPHVTNDFEISEPQLVELPDGSLFVNSRNDYHFSCNCRIISRSYDGAETFPWDQVVADESLPDPSCEGSTLLYGYTMFFSNPSHPTKRRDMAVKWSTDFGKRWGGTLSISHSSSAYSCLTAIDNSHIGLLYEKQGYESVSFVKIKVR
ncbi:sialidase-1-like [Glandiceps talaboti]